MRCLQHELAGLDCVRGHDAEPTSGHVCDRRVMQQDWVRHVADQCLKYNVPLFHKQYYRDNQLTFDGFIDGVCHQNFPASPAAAV